jgi:hypothetical protein
VAWDDRQAGRARYVRLGGRRTQRPKATILLKSEPRSERRQWAIAHEIGEHVAHRVFAFWQADPQETPPNAREAVANHLAGRLLLPTAWFAADGMACQWGLPVLKARYPTASHELIARRMLECRPAVIISIFDQRRLTFRRSNVPGRVPPPSPAEIQCQRQIHERGTPLMIESGVADVRGWPIHEPGWRREILRTAVNDWADAT